MYIGVVPVFGTTAKSVDCLKEEPIGIWWGEGTTMRGFKHKAFIWRDYTITESILEIALFEKALIMDG